MNQNQAAPVKQAMKLAIKAMRAEIKRLAVDANLFDKYKVDYPLARKSSIARAELIKAISVLESLIGSEKPPC